MQAKALRRFLSSSLFFLLAVCNVQAQELEYALELGAMGGLTSYYGDANYTSPLKNMNAGGAVFGRYNLNPRMSLKLSVGFSKISGDARKSDNKFPDLPEQQWKFSNSLADISCMYELSFWGYGAGTGYKGTRRLTPYMQLGLGATVCNKEFALNLPIGIGVKYKFAPRWNCGIDWMIHFTTTDKMDGIQDPYGLKSGTMKNKDSYSMLHVYVAYDLCPKYRKCNNE